MKPKAGVCLAALGQLHEQFGVRVLRTFENIGNLQVVLVPAGVSLPHLLRRYQKSGLVEYAELDYEVEPLATPGSGTVSSGEATDEPAREDARPTSNRKLYHYPTPDDPRYGDGSLWPLNNMGHFEGKLDANLDAPESWGLQNTATNIVVAVIDTGVRLTHEDLAGNAWVNPGESGSDFLNFEKQANRRDDDDNGYLDDVHGINAILGTGIPFDEDSHGTHVAGIIGVVGNDGVGVAGVARRVPIIACQFINANLPDVSPSYISDAIECIDYARNQGAKIINASWGGYGCNSTALYEAIDRLRQAGIIFVAACGNDDADNDANPLYPASYPLDNIIAVAATTRADEKATWSNFGASSVDLGAPGLEIVTCWNTSDDAYQYSSGTSMAAAHVSGACAVVWARYPDETYRQIIDRVLAATDPLPTLAGRCVTGGRLNLERALAPDTAHVMQASAEFANWTSIPTNHAKNNGRADLTEAASNRFRNGVDRTPLSVAAK